MQIDGGYVSAGVGRVCGVACAVAVMVLPSEERHQLEVGDVGAVRHVGVSGVCDSTYKYCGVCVVHTRGQSQVTANLPPPQKRHQLEVGDVGAVRHVGVSGPRACGVCEVHTRGQSLDESAHGRVAKKFRSRSRASNNDNARVDRGPAENGKFLGRSKVSVRFLFVVQVYGYVVQLKVK